MYGLFSNTYDYYEWHDLICVADSEQEIAELKAHINDLREALERINDGAKGIAMSYIHKQCKEALLKTPAQHINNDVLIFTKDSLQEHDNEVIEKCAKVVDESYAFDSDGFSKEIRTLKT